MTRTGKELKQAVEDERERIRKKIVKRIGQNLGLGLVPLAEGINAIGVAVSELAADPANADKAKALDTALAVYAPVLSQNYRGAVKQVSEFVTPPRTEVEHSGSIQTTGFTPDEIAALRSQTAPETEPETEE